MRTSDFLKLNFSWLQQQKKNIYMSLSQVKSRHFLFTTCGYRVSLEVTYHMSCIDSEITTCSVVYHTDTTP